MKINCHYIFLLVLIFCFNAVIHGQIKPDTTKYIHQHNKGYILSYPVRSNRIRQNISLIMLMDTMEERLGTCLPGAGAIL